MLFFIVPSIYYTLMKPNKGGQGRGLREIKWKRESTRGQGRCVLAQILTESDAEEGGMVGKGKFSE